MHSRGMRVLVIAAGSVLLVLTVTYLVLTGSTPIAPTSDVRWVLVIANLLTLCAVAAAAVWGIIVVLRRTFTRR